MSEKEPNVQSDFMIEKIKERPINKGKLVKRMLLTAAMAVILRALLSLRSNRS